MRRAIVVTAVLLSPAAVLAQEGTRQIWDSGFRQKRPVPADAEKRPSPPPPIEYRTSGPVPPPDAPTTVIGFTVWRLRPALSGDTSPRLLVQDTGSVQPTAFVQERLRPDARLRIGNRVRLGIEVAQEGFLYVVNRERYVDGSSGTPHLIFPARRLRNGDNRVSPGRLVEIPDQQDAVPALRLQRADARHAGEELLVVVTTRPIENLSIAEREIALPVDQVAEWERRWRAPARRLDQPAAEAAWTLAEQAAGVAQRLLTQEDPLPATLLSVPRNGDGIAVVIPLLVE